MSENGNKALDPKLQEALAGIWDALTDEITSNQLMLLRREAEKKKNKKC